MAPTTQQLKTWQGTFGKEYTDRNTFTGRQLDAMYTKRYGTSRTLMNKTFIGRLSKKLKILEVGTNVGNQLVCLQNMGFENLYGIEPQAYAVERSKNLTRNISIIKADAFDIPFKDNYFDIVFTSGVLIHINPKDISRVMKEVYRCSKQFIWGFEYFAPEYSQITYRGKKSLLWKADFAKIYADSCKGLSVVKKQQYGYINETNVDEMFLLKKND